MWTRYIAGWMKLLVTNPIMLRLEYWVCILSGDWLIVLRLEYGVCILSGDWLSYKVDNVILLTVGYCYDEPKRM